GIRSRSINSTDLEELTPVAREAVEYVRSEQRPFWLHIETVRLQAHSKSDDTRPEAELHELRKRDCLSLMRQRVGGPQAEALDDVVRTYLDQCLEAAMASAEACG